MCQNAALCGNGLKENFLMQGECEGFSDLLDAYNEVTPTVKLGGPTNFAPLIEEAVKIVKKTRKVCSNQLLISGLTFKLQHRFRPNVMAQFETCKICTPKIAVSIISMRIGNGHCDMNFSALTTEKRLIFVQVRGQWLVKNVS